MQNIHLISGGDVLMTHLSGRFIDAGPSAGTVALKKQKKQPTTWLAVKEEEEEEASLNNLPIKTRLSPPHCRRQTAPGGGL